MNSSLTKFSVFRFVQRILSPLNLLLSSALLLIMIIVIVEQHHMMIDVLPRMAHSQTLGTGPDRRQKLVPDTSQRQVYTATSLFLMVAPEAEVFLYFRKVVPLLAFMLPLIAFIFSYRSIAGERESGLSLSLFSLPVPRRDLVWGT